jgi:GNAT superfamily N-acetyltransferase
MRARIAARSAANGIDACFARRNKTGMKLDIRSLTPGLWPALEDLFGKQGASSGCWCMYWRIGREYWKRPREENRKAFKLIVKRGPPPGLLAFDGDLAVGWCQITPREDLPYLDDRPSLARVDDAPVLSISCFFVRRGYRRKGVMSALVKAALETARRAGAPAVEAYPRDADAPAPAAYTGFATTFARAGFREVGRRKVGPIMRCELKAR